MIVNPIYKKDVGNVRVTVSRSYGKMIAYLSRGYAGRGWVAGVNTRWGGYSVWIRENDHDDE